MGLKATNIRSCIDGNLFSPWASGLLAETLEGKLQNQLSMGKVSAAKGQFHIRRLRLRSHLKHNRNIITGRPSRSLSWKQWLWVNYQVQTLFDYNMLSGKVVTLSGRCEIRYETTNYSPEDWERSIGNDEIYNPETGKYVRRMYLYVPCVCNACEKKEEGSWLTT